MKIHTISMQPGTEHSLGTRYLRWSGAGDHARKSWLSRYYLSRTRLRHMGLYAHGKAEVKNLIRRCSIKTRQAGFLYINLLLQAQYPLSELSSFFISHLVSRKWGVDPTDRNTVLIVSRHCHRPAAFPQRTYLAADFFQGRAQPSLLSTAWQATQGLLLNSAFAPHLAGRWSGQHGPHVSLR